MTKLIHFEGDYYREGKEYFSKITGTRLTLAERHTQTTTKPPLFLLCRFDTHEQKKYVSSLYSTGVNNIFSFEYGGFRYILRRKDPSIQIERA